MNSRLSHSEEHIHDLEDRVMEITYQNSRKKFKLRKNVSNL